MLQLLMEANAHTGGANVSAGELTAGDEADSFEEQKQSSRILQDDESSEKRLTDEQVVQNAWIVMLAGWVLINERDTPCRASQTSSKDEAWECTSKRDEIASLYLV